MPQNLSAEINVDIGNSAARLQVLQDRMARLQAIAVKAGAGTEKFYKALDLIKKTGSQINVINKFNTSIGSVQRNVGTATQALTNFNRVVQDAPFGIIGIANNIDPLIQSFQKLKSESGSTGGAIKALLGSLAGPTGILFAFSALSTAATVLVQKYGSLGNAYDVLMGKTKALTDEQKKAVEDQRNLAVNIEKQRIETEQLVKVAQGDIGSKGEQKAAIDRLNAAIPDYIGVLTEANIKTAEGAKIINTYTDALFKQATAELLTQRAAELAVKQMDSRTSTIETLKRNQLQILGLEKEIEKQRERQSKSLGSSYDIASAAIVGLRANIDGLKAANKSALDSFVTDGKDAVKQMADLRKQIDLNTVVLDTSQDAKTGTSGVKKLIEDIEKELDATTIKGTPKITVLPSGIEIEDGLKKLNEQIQQSIDTSKATATYTIPARVIIKPDAIDKTLKNLNDGINKALENFNVDAFAQIGVMIGEGIVNGASGIQKAAAGLGILIGDLFSRLGQEMIKFAVASKAIQIAIKSLNPIVALGAGIALIALGSALKSSLSNVGATAFANGGIVTGPTLGLIGEAGQPEIIIPLSKMNQFLDGAGGAQKIQIEGVVSGENLAWIMNRANRKSNRLF